MFIMPSTILAAEERVVIDIQDMTCSLCSVAVRKSLADTEGVSEVNISFKEKRGYLIVEESVTDDELLQAIMKAGSYKGKIIERKPSS
jgi:mercuric ion binding protein